MNLRKIYHEHAQADRYLIGFTNKHEQAVYAAWLAFEQVEPFLVDDMTAANEQGERFPCIRFKVGRNRDRLEAGLLPNWERIDRVRRVCTEAELKAHAKANGLNLGEAFEALACERLNLKRNANTTEAWYDGPDAWDTDGSRLQVGFEGKTFTYTAQVERMGWA